MQVKNSIQLYTDLFVQALDDEDPRMRLATVIAMAEASIENLTFQMKVGIEELASGGESTPVRCQLNEIGVVPKLFVLMRTAIPHAGRSLDDINDQTKLVAWCCYAIVHVSANCLPNILLLRSNSGYGRPAVAMRMCFLFGKVSCPLNWRLSRKLCKWKCGARFGVRTMLKRLSSSTMPSSHRASWSSLFEPAHSDSIVTIIEHAHRTDASIPMTSDH